MVSVRSSQERDNPRSTSMSSDQNAAVEAEKELHNPVNALDIHVTRDVVVTGVRDVRVLTVDMAKPAPEKQGRVANEDEKEMKKLR
jgi:hypothetical protein